jgi:hypothetical protein
MSEGAGYDRKPGAHCPGEEIARGRPQQRTRSSAATIRDGFRAEASAFYRIAARPAAVTDRIRPRLKPSGEAAAML